MATPYGTFELKYFFGSSLNTDAGGNASSTAVRALIKQLVAAEDRQEAAVRQPAQRRCSTEQGIQVARRTVAKYREALKIAPANLRRTCERRSCREPVPTNRGSLFLPCAAGVEALLADEVQRAAAGPGAATARAAASALAGGAEPAMRLNLESRLAQRVLWPRGRRRRTATSTTSTRWRTPCAGTTGSRPSRRCASTPRAQRSPLQSLNFAALRIKDAVCDALREARRRAARRRHPRPRPAAGAAPGRRTTPRCTSTPRASRCSSAAGASDKPATRR